MLELVDGVDGLLRHELGGRLVDQVVAALHRVEGVPLRGVLLHVRERGAHAALRGARVRARGVELGDDGGADLLRGLDGRPQPGAAGADDDRVVGVGGRHVSRVSGHFDGSNVNTITVPSTNSMKPSV